MRQPSRCNQGAAINETSSQQFPLIPRGLAWKVIMAQASNWGVFRDKVQVCSYVWECKQVNKIFLCCVQLSYYVPSGTGILVLSCSPQNIFDVWHVWYSTCILQTNRLGPNIDWWMILRYIHDTTLYSKVLKSDISLLENSVSENRRVNLEINYVEPGLPHDFRVF